MTAAEHAFEGPFVVSRQKELAAAAGAPARRTATLLTRRLQQFSWANSGHED
jgi:hypothetical protein